MKDEVLCIQSLARVGERSGLGRCINVNGGTTAVTSSMMATSIAAVLGAVEKKAGSEALRGVMATLGLMQHPMLSL